MDRFDRLLLIGRPIVFVILPALATHAWLTDATLGAVVGFAFMWNFMATHENAELAVAFKELRDSLDEIRSSQAENLDVG